ncbi:glycosyltransferase [Falsiroseomonas sp.]|uniref:glycosyltransferase n=1 Tax=Falsiroseomonas sp. TaxID=2870721 RepID=UPI002715AB15|nr:glycosyltransferase [Falsiroseomonas sp.]MDO9500806.1 glycosyltransferase [Falsiroseomonas sp.]
MTPRRVLMTVDAVGGVWRYAVDLCRALNGAGVEVLLACLGPHPNAGQRAELAALRRTHLQVVDAPLDWMAEDAAALAALPRRLEDLAAGCDLLHLNLPSQAAGMGGRRPVVVVSHSCVVTWWAAMRAQPLPEDWAWQKSLNARGLARADAVVAPSQSHAVALRKVYGLARPVHVVPTAGEPVAVTSGPRGHFVLAAGRWWDEGKGPALLDAAAARVAVPVQAAGECTGINGQGFAFRHVQALGPLPHSALRARMRRCAIFASPSQYEPFGLAALEAGQGGAPLLLADIPTYREIWDGAAQFARDAMGFAAAIKALMEDSPRRAALGARARERSERYTSEPQLSALLAAYASSAAASSSSLVD